MFKFHNLSFLIDNHSQLHKYQFTKNFCDCNGFGEDWTYSNYEKNYIDFFDTVVFWTPVATFGVSWLKIKPVVLIFPVIASAFADSITLTTVRSLWGNDSQFYSVLIDFRFLTFVLMVGTKAEDALGFIVKTTVKSLWCFQHKKGIKALLLLCFYTFFLYKFSIF